MTDRGTAVQRTRLAWRRTATSSAAVALLVTRQAIGEGGRVRLLLAAGALAGWAALVILAYRRGRGLALRPPRPGRRTLPLCALITAAFALLGTLLVWY